MPEWINNKFYILAINQLFTFSNLTIDQTNIKLAEMYNFVASNLWLSTNDFYRMYVIKLRDKYLLITTMLSNHSPEK